MEPWLELRSGAPGLDGPFLLERRLGYQIFDERAEQPDVFLAIGGKTKRRFLRRLRAGPSVKHNGVIIEEILSSTILLDCELHDSTLPRIKAEPYIESCPRHHLLTTTISDISTPQEIARCAFDFVWQALVPFSSTIVVFMDDLGGLVQLSDILATWAARPTQSQPRIVVLHDAQLRVNQGHFETMVLRKLGARLLQLELLGSPRRRRMPFESVHFLPINNASAVDILSHIDRASAIRRKMGLAFRSQHLTDLLHQSIKQFAAAEPAPFDLYTTARRCNPVSKSLASNITHFLAISRNLHFDRPSVIASALVLDALPPGMHAFLPGSMFDHFYHDILASVDAALGLSLSASTRARFIQLVEERRDKSTHVQHVSFIAKQQGLWMNCQSTEICLVCLARPPRRRLSCGHRLCDACVIMCELVPLPSADWPRDYCPLCQKKNSIELILRPATAGVRALKLGGTLQSTAAMVDFLRQLQYHIGLPLHALRKQFDMVIGSDIGVFFAQTIFLEGWTIAESGHHVNKLAEPNLTKRSTISFGKGLEWDLETTRLFNELDVTLKVKDMIYSNTNNTDYLKRSHSTDVTIHCNGDKFESQYIYSIADRMIASLFYIELLQVPNFHSAPEVLYLRLRCRVPTGLPLVTLLYRLRLAQVSMIYQTASSKCTEEQLITVESLERCKAGRIFSRLIKVEVMSYRTRLDVKIRARGYRPCNISNCPYILRELVRDSKLDCVFGREDHQVVTDEFLATEIVTEEMDRLQETMGHLMKGIR